MNGFAVGIIRILMTYAFVFALFANIPAQIAQRSLEMEGGSMPEPAQDEMSDEEVQAIQEQIRANIEKLAIEGRLSAIPALGDGFSWPLGAASGSRMSNRGVVNYFVDHNPLFPNQLRDWNCGMRTYDADSGSNHRGTDILAQPFPFLRMERNEAYAIAAAPGMIILKRDGNVDRNCVFGTELANAVHLLHADGSTSWYYHLKNGSLTHKDVGETVAEGEFLGILASSGNSTIAHLHFQVHNAEMQLQDPYHGTCNSMNNFSWWTAQEPYRDSRILALMTGNSPVVFPGCPNAEIANERIVFQPGAMLVTTAFYRDQLEGHETFHSIIRPDSTVFESWTHTSPATYNFMRYWFRTWTLPMDAAAGEWRYRAEYQGQVHETIFYVGQPANTAISGRVTTVEGKPLGRAHVVFSGPGLTTLSARTNPFGYYSVKDVVIGASYDVNVAAKGMRFLPRVVTPVDEINDLNLFLLETE